MNVPLRDCTDIEEFTENYLRRDGLLILRLISKNAGVIVAAEILRGLWMNFVPLGTCRRNRTQSVMSSTLCEKQPILAEME